MKQQAYKWLCAIFIAGIFSPLYQAAAQTSYPVPITLAVNSTGINRFIADQWNNVGFTKYWHDCDYNLNVCYEFQLNGPPIIILTTNSIKIVLNIFVITLEDEETVDLIYDHRYFTIKATLTIPPTTITLDNIYAQFADFQTDVNNAIDNAKMRALVVQKLAQTKWIMYKWKILSISTPPLNKVSGSDRLYWNISPPTLTFSVYGGELDLTVTPTITAN